MDSVIERQTIAEPERLVGTFRRFGDEGPVYEVIAIADGRHAAVIRVVESGEELEYPLEKVADDDEE
jgi:hypothetical protein